VVIGKKKERVTKNRLIQKNPQQRGSSKKYKTSGREGPIQLLKRVPVVKRGWVKTSKRPKKVWPGSD